MNTYEPLSSLDHSKDERDAHRIHWLEGEVKRLTADRDQARAVLRRSPIQMEKALAEAEEMLALCAADTTAVDLRQEIEFAVTEIGLTILALRACDEANEPVPSQLRARIRVMENEWFNRPTPEGARRREMLSDADC